MSEEFLAEMAERTWGGVEDSMRRAGCDCEFVVTATELSDGIRFDIVHAEHCSSEAVNV